MESQIRRYPVERCGRHPWIRQLDGRLRRAAAWTGLEPAEMARCAISEWLQRLEQPPLPFAAVEPPRAKASPPPAAPAAKKRGAPPIRLGKEGTTPDA